MRSFPIVAVATMSVALAGCNASPGSDGGPLGNRSFTVSGFTGIGVAGPYYVTVRTGAAPSVTASGARKALDRLRVEVKDGVLEIGSVKQRRWFGLSSWSDGGDVRLTVTVPTLERAEIAGSGEMTIDKVSGARFTGGIAGSGELQLAAIDVDELSLEIAGSGNARASGKAKSVTYEIAGSGDIDAAALTAETASVSIAGSGAIKGHASSTAKVDVAGSGDVALTGGAKCSVSKSGSGNIRCS